MASLYKNMREKAAQFSVKARILSNQLTVVYTLTEHQLD